MVVHSSLEQINYLFQLVFSCSVRSCYAKFVLMCISIWSYWAAVLLGAMYQWCMVETPVIQLYSCVNKTALYLETGISWLLLACLNCCHYIGSVFCILLLTRLMRQYCFACWCLSLSSVTLPAGGPGVWAVGRRRAGCRARGRSGGRHCTAGQYGYVLLGRHLVCMVSMQY